MKSKAPGSLVLANRRHEAFAQAVASGESLSAAYREHVGMAGIKDESRWVNACRLARVAKVAQRVSFLREQISQVANHASIASVTEVLQYHTRTLRTPILESEDDSDLIQEVTTTKTYKVTKVKRKLVSKTAAAQEIAKIRGYYKQTDLAGVVVPGLGELLDKIVRPGIPRRPKQ